MVAPTRPTAPTPRATRTSPDTFPALADATITYLFTDNPDYAEAVATFCEGQAGVAEAQAGVATSAAVAGNLSELDLSTMPGEAISVNLAGTALEGIELVAATQATETESGIAELATQSEAETGTNDLAMMTALKVKQAITAQTSVYPQLGVLHMKHETASGVGGGALLIGARRVRPITDEVKNTITGSGVVFEVAYDAQSANFTVGGILTGGTSGATATIVEDTDAGATGTLKVIGITGTFVDNETITDAVTGSATSNIAAGVQDANQFYIPAGTYRAARGVFVHSETTEVAHFIRDATGSVDLLGSMSGRSAASTAYNFESTMPPDEWVIGADSFIQIEVECSSSGNFGAAHSFGVNRYADLLIERLA